MKHTNEPESDEHFRNLQILYVDDLLPAQQRSEFEEHVRSCPKCDNEIKDLRLWYHRLTSEKDAFCPEHWELYEHIRGKDVSTNNVAKHQETCPICDEVASALRSAPSEKRMPDQLWDKMHPLLQREVADESESLLAQWLDTFRQKMADMFRSPTLAFGSVAAVLLVVVVIYSQMRPPVSRELVPMLSSTTWDLGLNLMSEARPRLAVVPFFEQSADLLAQRQVDNLYRAMSPPKDVTEHFEFIEPAQLKEQVGIGKVRLANRTDMLEDLSVNLEVSFVAVLIISHRKDGFGIEAQLIDAQTGKELRKESLRTGTADLGSGLEKVLTSLLSSQIPGQAAPLTH